MDPTDLTEDEFREVCEQFMKPKAVDAAVERYRNAVKTDLLPNKHEYRLILDKQDKEFLIEALVGEINGYIEVDHVLKTSRKNRIERLTRILSQLKL